MVNKKNSPFFSIIIPTYNRDKFIGRAIQSVIDQTFTDWELIIINDGGSDNTEEVVRGFNDDRIIYYWQENKGRSVARNLGLGKSRGYFIGFLDDDDYFLAGYLKEVYLETNKSENPKFSIFKVGQYIITNEIMVEEPYFKPTFDNLVRAIYYRGVSANQIIVLRSLATSCCFDTKLSVCEDYLYFLNLAIKSPEYKEITQPLVVCDNHSGRSMKLQSMDEINHERFCRQYVQDKIAESPLFKSFISNLDIYEKKYQDCNILFKKYAKRFSYHVVHQLFGMIYFTSLIFVKSK